MIDTFTLERFAEALPTTFKERQRVNGEWQFYWSLTSLPLRIVVRSSISTTTNMSAEAGEDSIRVWVEQKTKDGWIPFHGDTKRWTTRVPGWEARLKKTIKDVFYGVKDISHTLGDNQVYIKARTTGKVFIKDTITGRIVCQVTPNVR